MVGVPDRGGVRTGAPPPLSLGGTRGNGGGALRTLPDAQGPSRAPAGQVLSRSQLRDTAGTSLEPASSCSQTPTPLRLPGRSKGGGMSDDRASRAAERYELATFRG